MAGNAVDKAAIEITSKGFTKVGTLVIGAGLVGLVTAVPFAQRNSKVDKSTVVVEQGAHGTYRAQTPSQGSIRGSRVAQQTPELTRDIRATSDFIDYLEAKHGLPISKRATDKTPYLMLVKDPTHLAEMLADLRQKGSPHRVYTLEEAAREFGLNFPSGYAGVVNTLESRVLNIDNYIEAMGRELKDNRGSIRYEATIAKYGKLAGGPHLIELSDGSRYAADDLVVATGTGINRTLRTLYKLHANAHHSTSYWVSSKRGFGIDWELFARERDVPTRFLNKKRARIRQRTIHILFKDPKIVPRTVYNLDIDHEFKLDDGTTEQLTGHLGFYMFPEEFRDRNGKMRMGLKVGYDPMKCTSRNPHVLKRQEELMLDHISELYGVDRNGIEIMERHDCAYPIDVIGHPCMGRSLFHKIIIAAHFIGYGAMAAYGAAVRMLNGGMEPDSPYQPDIKPTLLNTAVFNSYEHGHSVDGKGGPMGRVLPTPPSAGLRYAICFKKNDV
ncbi:MAG: FAD-binding oxidoreductase [Proteobacteria bacterium]|nr:FAD-binding oxidoreductase [Pseudomonadota bacterium]